MLWDEVKTAQALLGHSTERMTLQIYSHRTSSSLGAVAHTMQDLVTILTFLPERFGRRGASVGSHDRDVHNDGGPSVSWDEEGSHG
jgi:hypothetical protein